MGPKNTKIASGSGKRVGSEKHTARPKKHEQQHEQPKTEKTSRRKKTGANPWERMTPGRRALVVLASVIVMAGLLALMMWTGFRAMVHPPVITQPPSGSAEPTAPNVSRQPSGTASPSGGHGTAAAARLDGMYTVLVMGHNQGLTDVMMVVGFDTANDKIEVVNIPRDTYSNDIPYNPKKINGAYNIGGMDLVFEAVEGVIGFRPDKYVMIDYDGFVALVDTLDGVEFDVPRNMRHISDSGKVDINLTKGLQVLNGEQALGLVRYRSGYADQDLGRIKTAQKFLTACAKKMVDTISFGKIGDYVNICIDYLDTDLTAGEMIWFVQQAFDVDMENDLNFHTPELNAYTYQGAAYVFLHADSMADLINRTVNPLSHDIKAEDLDIFNPITSGAGAVPETSTSGGTTTSAPPASGSSGSGGSGGSGSGSSGSGGGTSSGSGPTVTAAPSAAPSSAPSDVPEMSNAPSGPPSETSAEPVPGGTPSDEPPSETSEAPAGTDEPSAAPTGETSEEPSDEPGEGETSDVPASSPSDEPGGEPTEKPTEEPGAELTEEPGAELTEEPGAELGGEPAAEVTDEPSAEPSEEPFVPATPEV